MKQPIPLNVIREEHEPVGDRRGWFIALGAVALFTLILILFRGQKPPEELRWERQTRKMDTFVSIIAYGDSLKVNSAIDSAFVRMDQIERIASVFDSSAEAFWLNQHGRIDHPSPELVDIMRKSVEYYQLSGGAFDVTIEPTLRLWKAGLWRDTPELQAEKLNDVRKLVGSDKLTVFDDSLILQTPGMAITLGGIAKGYAVDQAMAVMEQAGITRILINAGGDLATKGSKPDGSPWLLDLTNPDNTSERAGGFKVAGQAVATSGNYERFFDPSKKAHHIVDPRTGYSAQGCISVTVIANSCLEADALATTLFVLGAEEGLKLVNTLNGVEAFIIDSDRKIHRSAGVSKFE